MAETKPKKKQSNPLVGAQTQPTTLGDTTKLDIDTTKSFPDSVIYAGLNGGLDIGAIEKFTSISNNRDQIYTVIDTMGRDSAVGAILKTFADCACELGDNGHVIWCESNDPKISKFINYLLNVINVDKNMYGWTYCLAKYGDVYLRMYRESDYDDGIFNRKNIDKAYSARNTLTEEVKKDLEEQINLSIHTGNDPYSYYVEMVRNPGTMYELTKYGKTAGFIETPDAEISSYSFGDSYVGVDSLQFANYKMKSNDINIYQADDFVHACLDEDFNRYPERVELFTNDDDYKNNTHANYYMVKRGKSMLIDNYKTWREKTLLESSILLNRVTRSSIFRKVGVEVGDMPKEQATQVLRRVKDLFEQKSSLNTNESFSEYNAAGPVENFIYFTTHNGQGQITVDSIGGDIDVKNLADLDNWVNKFYAGFGVPKAYYGYTDDGAGFNGGTSLSIISSVFNKGVRHLQNAMIQAVTDMINLILINKGLKAYLNNFVLKMHTPLSQEEKDYRDDLVNRVNAISNINSLLQDVDNKARRLTILKDLISTLNYGDNITFELDQEIEEIKTKQAEEAEQAKKDAEEQAKLEAGEAGGEVFSEAPAKEEKKPEAAEEDIDLGLSSVAPVESFTPAEGASLLVEGPDYLLNSDEDLPTPEEMNEKIDFSENK